MGCFWFVNLVLLSWVFFVQNTHELQTSQTEALMQIRKHLEYPSYMDIWEKYNGDLCSLPSTPQMSITCQDNLVTELKIMGDKLVKVSDFNGFPILNRTLSTNFYIDSFVTTLSRLTSLRVLSLVSLGIWGQVPDKIGRLSSLEVLDLSSNFMFGSIPADVSRLVKLQTLTLDGNYLNGSVPDNLDSLSNLTVLCLKSNRLMGRFPSSLCRIKTLTDIALSHNKFSGKLPDLRNIRSLDVLDVRENHFDSQLPNMPEGLVTALLSRNSFSGKIPVQINALRQLQHLDLSFNHLSGTPASALFSLPNISYLNLASNRFSGSLPKNLNCGKRLGLVDLSNNKLRGEIPSCLDRVSSKRLVTLSGNCLSTNDQEQNPHLYCNEDIAVAKYSKGRAIGVLIPVVCGAALILALLVLGSLLLFRKFRSRRTYVQRLPPKGLQDNTLAGVTTEVLANARLISEAAKQGTQGGLTCRSFSLEELKEATNNFDSPMFIGEGSAGKLYKGKLGNGTYVAIRLLTLMKKYPVQILKARLELLSKLDHPHLVGFIGHCIESGGQDDFAASKLLLVYEYVSNRNYRTHLSESNPDKVLTWSDRLVILIGVAKAVHFLHTGVIPCSFNNRLKTNNILLDEHRTAKLSDYGLCIITEENEKFETKNDNHKSSKNFKLDDDVYKFGFILLESLVGPVSSGKGETFLLNEMASFGSQDGRRRIVDPVVLTTSSQESLSIVVSITNKCISAETSLRPSFEDVLWNLQYAAQVQAAAEADQKLDASSLI